jgi:CheY-like chemotaxis protein/HPt (histidine-containing phosphotransfer) domain-containing protein
VLAVDDNATNRTILAEMLRQWGAVVTTAEDGARGLDATEAAARAGTPFDVLLLDMRMPGMSGLDVARRVAARGPGGPKMVLLTSTSERGEERAGREAGAAAYLTKPVRGAALYETLVTVLDRAPAPSPPEPQAAPGQSLHVLVVDDNAVNRRVAALTLEMLGHRADVAENGRAAVDAVRDRTYDLVLMDCHMPEMDGFAATEAIRAGEPEGRHVPIVAMTASAMSSDVDRCMAAGMDDFLAKPVRNEELAAVLARWAPDAGHAGHAGHTGHANGVLDPDIVEGLRALARRGGAGPLREILARFGDDAVSRVDAMRSAYADRDAATIAALAHSLKGSSATVGAHRVAERCDVIERGGVAVEVLDTLADEVGAAVEALRAVL